MKEITRVQEKQKKRVGLPPFAEMKKEVLNYLLMPNSNELSPYQQNILRSELGLPAAAPIEDTEKTEDTEIKDGESQKETGNFENEPSLSS